LYASPKLEQFPLAARDACMNRIDAGGISRPQGSQQKLMELAFDEFVRELSE
jgi:hypothetical protein